MSLSITACSSTGTIKVIEQERTKLELDVRKPLSLEDMRWRVLDVDSTIYYALDEKNFEKFTINIQRIQNRLYINNIDLNSYREYYEGLNQ